MSHLARTAIRGVSNLPVFKQAFQLEQSAPGSHVNGRWVPGAAITYDLAGSVQQPDSETISALPEGQRGRQTIVIWTTGIDATGAQIRPETTRDGEENNVVIYQGERFNVVKVDNWEPDGHYKLLCVRGE